MMYDPFNFVLLDETEDELRVCNGTFCCRLQYKWKSQGQRKELYALGAFAGTHTGHKRYALQVEMRRNFECLKLIYYNDRSLLLT